MNGVVRDNSRQQHEADALRESEERLRLALDASNAGTWSWDVASNTSSWDDRYHALYGLEPEEARSFEAWMGRVHPEDRPRLQARITSARRSTRFLAAGIGGEVPPIA